jgi:Tol biopolymer transport system component
MRWLAFIRAEPERPRVWNLWLRSLATGEIRRLTSHPRGQMWGASWFSDSRRLCYSHEDRLVVLDTASRKTATFRSPRAGRPLRTPAVAPDGRRVVFQVQGDGVWLLDLATQRMRRILPDSSAEEFAWDPTGRRFAYHSRRDGAWRIWLAAPPA